MPEKRTCAGRFEASQTGDAHYARIVLVGGPNIAPSVAILARTPFVERVALPAVDMSIWAVLLFPNNGE